MPSTSRHSCLIHLLAWRTTGRWSVFAVQGKDTCNRKSRHEDPEPPPTSVKPAAHKELPDYVAPKDDSDMSKLLEALPGFVPLSDRQTLLPSH